MTETQRAKELAEAHWNGYVGPMTATHATASAYTQDEVYKLCAFHYRTALVHGHRHGVEDERSGLFRPRIGKVAQYAPAHPYLHKDEVRNCNTCLSNTCKQIGSGKEGCSCWVGAKTSADYTPLSPSEVKEIAESVAPASLCKDCLRDSCSIGVGGVVITCANYLPPPSDEWETKDLCRRCINDECSAAGTKHERECCESYIKKKAPAPLSLSLPSITVEGGLNAVYDKLKEELGEWTETEAGSMAELVEAWDVIQVAQTYKERGGEEITRTLPNMELYHQQDPDRTEAAKRAMIIKNAARSMYASEVCSKIIMSGGHSW